MPQLSAEELRAAEAEATYTVQQVVATAVALYLCTFLISSRVVPPRRMHIRHRPLYYGCWTVADLSSASPLRHRRHLEDLLSTGNRNYSSHHSLLRQLSICVQYWMGDINGNLGGMAAYSHSMHSASAHGRWPKAFGLGNTQHPSVSYGQSPRELKKELEQQHQHHVR